MNAADTQPFFHDPDQAPSADDLPGADAAVVRESARLTLHPDGRTTRTVRRAVKIFTEYGRDRLSDTRVAFHAGRQELRVLCAATYMADGTRKDSPEVTRVVMTPWGLDRAPAWSDFQELVLTSVATETGAVAVVEYEVEDREPWRSFFFGTAVLGETWPVIRKEFEIAVPEGTALSFALRGGAPEPETSDEEGLRVHRWTVSELPAFPAEDQPASASYLVPAVAFSAAGSFDDIGRALAGRFEERAAPDADLKAWAAKTGDDIPDETDRLLRLHREMTAGLRSIEWPLPATDFDGRPAGAVFASRYATELEAAFALAAALRAAGIPRRFLLAVDRPLLDPSVPCLPASTEVWLWAGSEGRQVALRPSRPPQDTGPFHAAERSFLRLDDQGLRPFEPPVPANEAEIRSDITLDDALAATGKARFRLAGRFNPFLAVAASEDDEAVKGRVSALAGHAFPGASVESFDVRRLRLEDADLRAQVKADALTEAHPGAFFLEVAPPAKGLASLTFPLHRAERSTLLDLGGPFAVRYSLEITLPEGVSASALPENVDGSAGPFRYHRTWKADGRKLSLEEGLEAGEKYLPPGDYPDFRALALSFENPARNRVVLVRD